jgi:diguanylate cyclase
MNSSIFAARGPRLGARLMRAALRAAGLALLVAGVVLNAYACVALRVDLVDNLIVQARVTADNSSAAVIFGEAEAADDLLAGFQASPRIISATLFDRSGTPLASYSAAAAQHPPHPIQGAPANDGAQVAWGLSTLTVVEPIRQGDHTAGRIVLVASLAGLYARLAMYVAVTLAAALAALGLVYVLLLRVRTDVDNAESRLDRLAYFDPVTDLPNRHAANATIQRMIARGQQGGEGFALMLLDLDNFKNVNDTLGHPVGDELLRALAKRLGEPLGQGHSAFRYGGDEFLILAEGAREAAQLHRAGQAVLRALEAPLPVGTHELRVRASVGIARFPHDAADATGLVRAADTAMYWAKAQGRNTCSLFEARMDHGTKRRMHIDAELRRAVERQELCLHYQPIVDLASGRTVGVEALLRWTHPVLGLVSPAEFIPMAEDSGQIVDIGQWVLDTACTQMQAWRELGHDGLYVAINVSARQIKRGVLAQVEHALGVSGVDPRNIQIEITEHSLVENVESNIAQLVALRQLGIKIAIDDFGTGLSSLAYLKRLPIDKLKIDRAFVKGLPTDSDDAAIAMAVISMARALGLQVVAEGVESEAQRDMLVALECTYAQGYFYSRPVPAERVTAFLNRMAGANPEHAVWPKVMSRLMELTA